MIGRCVEEKKNPDRHLYLRCPDPGRRGRRRRAVRLPQRRPFGDVRKGHADIAALEAVPARSSAKRSIPDCLVLIETTVPPGTTEYVA